MRLLTVLLICSSKHSTFTRPRFLALVACEPNTLQYVTYIRVTIHALYLLKKVPQCRLVIIVLLVIYQCCHYNFYIAILIIRSACVCYSSLITRA